MSSCNIDVSADKLNKQEIRLAAQKLIKEGKTKQESFEILKIEFNYSKVIAKILKCIPTQNQKDRYRILNYLLFFSLLIPLVLYASQLSYAASAIYLLFLYFVLKIVPRMYIWISTISLISVISLSVIYFMEIQVNVILYLLLALSNIITLTLSIILEQKFCPLVQETKERYFDKFGVTRRRIIYTFTE